LPAVVAASFGFVISLHVILFARAQQKHKLTQTHNTPAQTYLLANLRYLNKSVQVISPAILFPWGVTEAQHISHSGQSTKIYFVARMQVCLLDLAHNQLVGLLDLAHVPKQQRNIT